MLLSTSRIHARLKLSRADRCTLGLPYLRRWSGQEHTGRAGVAADKIDRYGGGLDILNNHSRGEGIAMNQPGKEPFIAIVGSGAIAGNRVDQTWYQRMDHSLALFLS